MEDDDDEFGDLYTDVLRPFATSFSSQVPAQTQATTTTSSLDRPIDHDNIQGNDEEILFGARNSNSNPSFNPFISSQQNQQENLSFEPNKLGGLGQSGPSIDKTSDSDRNLKEDKKEEGLAGIGINWAESDSKTRVLERSEDVELQDRAFRVSNFMDEENIDVVVEERDDKDDLLVEKDEKLKGRSEDLENLLGRIDKTEKFGGDNEIGEMATESMIPEVSIPGISGTVDNRAEGNLEDDWDSDSEDDLQIVLNDNNHGPLGMERIGGGGDDDDEDEDGEPLVIVADSDNLNHQPMVEEQDWGEETAQTGDGERKELGDAAKVNGVIAMAPKIGYSNHGYHPFHSQFKYVRPGAAPMPGAAPLGPGGAPGQVRPPVNVGPITGRGRADWRPTGIRSASPMQKGFHPGYGMPLWGNNAGRGFSSGLDFTLPSHKTIFEVDIDSFEEKPWKLQGIDVSDFFNFGLNEESWKEYCKQLEQFRLEATMQSKIRVYEGGRTEQEFDPDLPPELAAAAGIHDVASENANLGKTDTGQSDFAKGSARMRPPLPTGRAIQVESGYGERLPSIDTRPARVRDSDAIIEIVLQDSTDGDSYPGNDIAENDPSREDFRGGDEIEDEILQENAKHFNGSPRGYDGRKRELLGRRAPFMNPDDDNITDGDGMMPPHSEALSKHRSDSRGNAIGYPDRNFGIPHDERYEIMMDGVSVDFLA
ncbi:unnamed protein product [Ilex paraguariensis]|uniref:Pre-mRNA polyadenylation factor Fip1 domain-containing protein n=1 Tax=Ilex paraguariensis TaxID=185542 RepID=A0ABC8TGM8_9AQUA